MQDFDFLDTDATDYYISIDNEMIGEMQGEFIVRQLTPGSGSVKYIELFCGDLADENAKVFFQGAMRKLKPYIDKGYIVVKSKQYDMKDIAIDNWDGELAKKRMKSLIQTVGYGPNSERIDAILSPNDSIADGIIFTLKKYGYTKENMPIITGCDASPIATDHIKNGDMAMTIYKSDELALAVVDAVTAMSKGQEPDYNDDFSYNNGVKIMKSLSCDPELIDYSNVNKVAY